MKHHDLEQFAGGKLSAQINKALQDVTENILDPNTDDTKVRKITVTISMKANKNRDYVATAVETKTTLAPTLGAVTALCVGKDLRTGEVDCVEIGSQIPGQLTLDLPEPEPERGYDQSTGEIYETEPAEKNKVVDLRKAKQEENYGKQYQRCN